MQKSEQGDVHLTMGAICRKDDGVGAILQAEPRVSPVEDLTAVMLAQADAAVSASAFRHQLCENHGGHEHL